MEAPRDAGIGTILILAGLPFYYYWNKVKKFINNLKKIQMMKIKKVNE